MTFFEMALLVLLVIFIGVMGGAIIFIACKLDGFESTFVMTMNGAMRDVSVELQNIEDIIVRDDKQAIHERDVAIQDLDKRCALLRSKLKAADADLQECKVTIESQLEEIERLNRALDFYVERFKD